MAVKLLDAVTVTGASRSQGFFDKTVSDHTVQATITGSPTAVIVSLEGSLDDSTWFTLAQHTFTSAELTAAAAMFHVNDKPVNYARINLATLTGGTSPTVTAWYAGLESK